MVDGFNTTFPLLLQLIFALLALLAVAVLNDPGFADEGVAEQSPWSVLSGALLLREAPPGSRFARAAALRSDVRGLPPDAIRTSRRYVPLFDRRT